MNEPASLETLETGRKAAYQFTLRDKIAGALDGLLLTKCELLGNARPMFTSAGLIFQTDLQIEPL